MSHDHRALQVALEAERSSDARALTTTRATEPFRSLADVVNSTAPPYDALRAALCGGPLRHE